MRLIVLDPDAKVQRGITLVITVVEHSFQEKEETKLEVWRPILCQDVSGQLLTRVYPVLVGQERVQAEILGLKHQVK